MKSATPDESQVEALRAFNRFYTQRIGVLDPYLGGTMSLTEVRVLYELAQATGDDGGLTASALAQGLGIDPAYLSRILRRFEQRQWLRRRPDPRDARQYRLQISTAGRKAFAPLQERSRNDARAALAPMPPAQRTALLGHLAAARALLTPDAATPAPALVTLRDPQAGDMGWVVQAHGEVYAREFQWDRRFEALVAEIVAQMIRTHDPAHERGWIAEIDRGQGPQRVGSVFVVRRSKTVAQLRLLMLTPEARGLGLGARLTDACIAFARERGYRKLMLWTHANLVAARAIYAQRGFRLTRSEAYEAFGHPLVSEFWELKL